MNDAESGIDVWLRRAGRASASRPEPETHPDEGLWRAWRDGGLPPADEAALDAHLAACGSCRAAVRAWARGVPPERLTAITEASLAALPRARPRWSVPLALGGLAAAAAVTLTMVVPRDPTAPPPASYEIGELTGPRQSARGPTAVGDLVLPEAEFSVTLRPVSTLTGPAPLMRAYAAVGAGARLVPLPEAAIVWSRDGSVTLRGRADGLFGPAPEAATSLELAFVFATTPAALEAFDPAHADAAASTERRIERIRLRYGRADQGP